VLVGRILISLNQKKKMDFDENYIKEKYSKRHHYLPVFYLKGFADKDGLIYVYDKINDRIFPKQKPESKFYEKNLNNYVFEGEVKFTLEEPVFTPMDTYGSKLFTKINSSEFVDEKQLTALDRFEILSFITRLFWRSPESNELFIDIIKKEGLSNKYFGFQREGETEFVPDNEIEEIKFQILNDKEIQKVFKHIIPLANGTQEEIYRLYDKWKIYSLKVETPNIIVGDNPFLINNDDIRLDNVFNELIFPVSKHKLLTLTDKAPNFFDNVLMTSVNLSILHQSKRFIATDSEEQLQQLLVYYNKLVQMNLEKNLIRDTFGLMTFQSGFNAYDEYLKSYKEGKEKYIRKS